MAYIKVRLRTPSVEEGTGSVFYQVVHEGRVRQVSSGLRLRVCDWDESRGAVRLSGGCDRGYLMRVQGQVRRELARFARIIRRLDDSGYPYVSDDVVREYSLYAERGSLSCFMEGIISDLRLAGRVRTAETYRSALNSFGRFFASSGCRESCEVACLLMDELDGELAAAYEGWLRSRGAAPNTVSYYMRILRAAYNRAVECGLTEDRHPFRSVYTGVDKTRKRALPLRLISRIKGLDLSGSPALDLARDMFMMSFYLRGMSFVDMAFLRKRDLRGGYLTYRRRKTGRQLVIKWTAEMRRIVEKYPANGSEYLLPVIREPGVNERSAYRNMNYNINRSLKKIAAMSGIDEPLTLYVARHSWASAAKAKGVPLGVISEGMGHDSEATTQIYLASLDTAAVDRANAIILKSL